MEPHGRRPLNGNSLAASTVIDAKFRTLAPVAPGVPAIAPLAVAPARRCFVSHSLFLVRRLWTVGLGALVLLGIGSGQARAGQVVVMKSGARIEVTSAYEEGVRMRLDLPG